MDKSKVILTLFFVAVLANLSGHVFGLPDFVTYSKPLLMPLLLFFIYEKVAGHVTAKILWLAAALIFSWIGDVALMYGDDFFLPGVGAFLIAQVLYCILFVKSVSQRIIFSFVQALPFALYGIVLFYFLLPAANALMIPVFIYGCSVLTMVSLARMRSGRTSVSSFQLTFAGAVLFVISDSVLGYDKFVESIPGCPFLVMLTYSLAQVLITIGILRHAD